MVENYKNNFSKEEIDPTSNDEMEQDGSDEETEENVENEEDLYFDSEEFASIDNQLDMLNSALDKMEQRNDSILAELTTLLNENREIRKQLQECRLQEENVDMKTEEKQ